MISFSFLVNPIILSALIKLLSTNVPLMDKPSSCYLLKKSLKNTCGRVTWFELTVLVVISCIVENKELS